MTTQATLKKVRASMMNAIHDLPLLVARDERFFEDEGLDAPYTRGRFYSTYQWTLGWGLVAPGATYEDTVDNRAWT